MAYFPIITIPGSPGTDPAGDGYFTVPGYQTAVFHGIVGSPPIPATEFIAFDDALPSSLLYPFAYPGSPVLLRFTVSSVLFDGTNTLITPTTTIEVIAGTYQQLVDSPYVLPYSDNSKIPISVPALENDSTTDLVFPARGVLDFGQIVDTNFLHLLENFAGPCPPGQILTGSPPACAIDPQSTQNSPIEGQLWFDTGIVPPTIKVWDGVSWIGFEGVGTLFDDLVGNGSPVVTTTNVNVQTQTATQAFQQVFKNGVLQRETGNYNVTGPNQLTFTVNILVTDEVLVYGI